MSYCRFGWDGNQAYIFGTTRGNVNLLECCGCAFGDSWDFDNYGDMLRHLNDHRSAGHFISTYVDEAMWDEILSLNPDDRWVDVGELPDTYNLNPPQPEEAAAFKRYKAQMEEALSDNRTDSDTRSG